MFHDDFRQCVLKIEESELCDNLSIFNIEKFKRELTEVYDNVDEYLERQFYIHREDCFYHLKQAIIYIRKNRIRDISYFPEKLGVWRYNNVIFSDLSIDFSCISYLINFKTIGKVDWEDNKQLRYGSLLCLSHDCFKTFILATVSESNISDLKRGCLKVRIMDSPLLCDTLEGVNFEMLEMQAYFESYIHVLKRLQNLDDSSFPFVDCFLKRKISDHLVKNENFISRCDTSSFEMDSSQEEAFNTALSNSISVIQGPPGTGKTSVGFRIVERILKQSQFRYFTRKPILVVCYTNHALDQFLEKIMDICKRGDIIRIGSKSESQKLKSCNIRDFVNEWKSRKQFPQNMIFNRSELRNKLTLLKIGLLTEKEFQLNRVDEAKEYERLLTEFKKCGMNEHLMIMRTAKVIGMTTTGCARYSEVLSELGCEVVIIEEAAEILEAHVICSLNSKCRQLIMIGDHQQLQPSATVMEFEDAYNLNVSLFERLIKNGFKHVTLTTQRRMRPEISRCIFPIYPSLEDHPNVKTYPNVQGMKINMYFFDHTSKEASIFDTSYKNSFEVSFVKGICNYLLNSGVTGNKITVLTTYRGQKFCITQQLREEKFKDIGVFVVDAYQGEENDVIILSLVRSNTNGRIGFLKKPNRICVALSRARYGFFVVGNMTCLISQSFLWCEVSEKIGKNQGSKLPVECSRNKNHKPIITKIKDFENENLCTGICEEMFACGIHICKKICHSDDHLKCQNMVELPCARKLHQIKKKCYTPLRCRNSIISLLACGHSISHRCDEVDVNCTETVMLILPCAHEQNVLCGTKAKDVICNQAYLQTLICGHLYTNCSPYDEDCFTIITKTLPCSHDEKVKCCERKSDIVCSSLCLKVLACGHICVSKCEDCFNGRLHMFCQEMCPEKLYCNHPCKDHCHSGKCSECKNNCLISSFLKLFVMKTRMDTGCWKSLVKSLHSRMKDKVFEDIIKYISTNKVNEIEQSNVFIAYKNYVRVVKFINEVLEKDFNDLLTKYIDYIIYAVLRIFHWLNPLERRIDEECINQLDLELCRLKDIFSISLRIQSNDSFDNWINILNEIKDSVYNGDKREQFRIKILEQID